MKIVFLSNYFNHHQKAISDQLYYLTNGNYHFIETDIIPQERKDLGWGNEQMPNYVHYINSNSKERNLCMQLIKKADVIITGSASEKYLLSTHFMNKLILRYSERLFKNPKISIKYIAKIFILEHLKKISMSKTYMLCASAYTEIDFSKLGLYKYECFKWGYFPEFIEYDVEELLSNKNKNLILWCGRFLDWKHPEEAILLAKYLSSRNIEFKIQMIGSGPLKSRVIEMININHLNKNVEVLDAQKPFEIRKKMEIAGIYIFTSDRNEGWGAVLNESMNSGCAVVANSNIGSVPYLIRDAVNGIAYQDNNMNKFYESVEKLLIHKDRQVSLGKKAYYTILNEWNPITAADRLINLSTELLKKENKLIYNEGPCSYIEKRCTNE